METQTKFKLHSLFSLLFFKNKYGFNNKLAFFIFNKNFKHLKYNLTFTTLLQY